MHWVYIEHTEMKLWGNGLLFWLLFIYAVLSQEDKEALQHKPIQQHPLINSTQSYIVHEV